MANSAAIQAIYAAAISVTETFSGFTDPADDSILINGINQTGTLNADSSPAVSLATQFSIPLVSGSLTIDLTALPGLTPDETIDGSGTKVQLLMFYNPSSNANKITVTKGGSDGYGLDASGDSWTAALSPGQAANYVLDGAAPTISGTVKNIDLTGTGSQALSVAVVMG